MSAAPIAAGCAVLLALLGAAPAPAAYSTGRDCQGVGLLPVRSGALQATAPDAGPLRWRDGRGREVLRELARAGGGAPGRAGFRTAAGWFHATRVFCASVGRDGRREAVYDTDDPAGRGLAVALRRGPEGVIAVRIRVLGSTRGVLATGIGFAARRGERWLGFGERSDAVARARGEVESSVGEGAWPRAARGVPAAIVVPWGFRSRDDATTYPVPWLLSTRGHGALVRDDERSRFSLRPGGREEWAVEVDAPRLHLDVLAGPRPADALRRMTALTGRQPAPRAPWFLGVWVMPNDFDREDVPAELRRIRTLRAGDVPVSVAETTLQYLPCGDARRLRAASRARVRGLHAAGLRILAYAHPMICTRYAGVYPRFARNGWLGRRADGAPYVYRTFADRYGSLEVSQVDFTRPAAVSGFQALLAQMPRDGYDGWMEDYGEYSPPDVVSASGIPGARLHNAYPRLYHCASAGLTARASRPLAAFVRSGWTGSARCSRLVWSGDPTATWGFDGLRSALANGLSMGLSGVALWASELGGLFELDGARLDRELLLRWIELGAVSPWMKARKKAIVLASAGSRRPQVWDPDVLPVFRRWAKLHTQLWPYLQAAVERYRRDGLPLMRHLALTDPGDPRAAARDDEFRLGSDLLAAPVLAPGARSRALYLPRGPWIDLWRSARYRRRTGGLRLGTARLLRGGRDVRLPAPLGELPLLVRAGALLPLLPPDVDTLGPAPRGGGVVTFAARERRREILAFPRGRSRAAMPGGEGLASVEGRRGWTLAIRGRRTRRYAVQASLGALRRPFVPQTVLVDGRVLRRGAWRYDRRTHVLALAVRGRALRVAALRPR